MTSEATLRDAVRSSKPRRMVWVYPDNLRAKMNSAPTLRITSALREAGWHVDLLAGGKVPETRATEIEGVDVIELPRPDTFLLKQFVYHFPVVHYLLSEWDTIDVVFFRQMSLPWMLILRAAASFRYGKVLLPRRFPVLQSRRRPLFVMDTRTMPMARSGLRNSLRSLYTDAMNRLANHSIEGQTTITVGMAEVYGIPPRRLLGTWPSGVDLSLFSPVRDSRRWPEPHDRIEIIYLGQLAPGRDLMPLSEAVCLANKEGMRFGLTFVGDGPDHDRLAAFAEASGGSVRVIDRVPHDQIPALLSHVHIGALPFPDELEFRVSSPIKLFEYLASGMPVLATRIDCHTDVLGDTHCAFWAEDSSTGSLTTALGHVWEGRCSLRERGRAAGELAEAYTWTASATRLVQALERGLERHGR